MARTAKIRDRFVERARLFIRKRKPGRFSPKSKLLWIQAGAKYPEKTPQQVKISKIGKACGLIIRTNTAMFGGSANVGKRRKFMGACASFLAGKIGKELLPKEFADLLAGVTV